MAFLVRLAGGQAQGDPHWEQREGGTANGAEAIRDDRPCTAQSGYKQKGGDSHEPDEADAGPHVAVQAAAGGPGSPDAWGERDVAAHTARPGGRASSPVGSPARPRADRCPVYCPRGRAAPEPVARDATMREFLQMAAVVKQGRPHLQEPVRGAVPAKPMLMLCDCWRFPKGTWRPPDYS